MSNVIFSQKLYDTAQMVVDGCMGDADPACQTACPMHTDVKQYVRLAGEGNYQEASFCSTNPFKCENVCFKQIC